MTGRKTNERIEELDEVYSSGVLSHWEGDRRVQFVNGDDMRRRRGDLARQAAAEAGKPIASVTFAGFRRG